MTSAHHDSLILCVARSRYGIRAGTHGTSFARRKNVPGCSRGPEDRHNASRTVPNSVRPRLCTSCTLLAPRASRASARTVCDAGASQGQGFGVRGERRRAARPSCIPKSLAPTKRRRWRTPTLVGIPCGLLGRGDRATTRVCVPRPKENAYPHGRRSHLPCFARSQGFARKRVCPAKGLSVVGGSSLPLFSPFLAPKISSPPASNRNSQPLWLWVSWAGRGEAARERLRPSPRSRACGSRPGWSGFRSKPSFRP